MKAYAREIFKRNIQFILFVSLTFICVITILMSIRAMSLAKKPLIIAIDANGTRVVSELNDPVFRTEAVAFIQRFVFNVYNYNPENFMKRIGFATVYMSESLWKKKRTEILSLKTKVERDDIMFAGEVQKITVDEAGTYYGLVSVREKTRMNVQNHQIRVAVKIKAIARSHENPFGMEVDSYEENIIRD